MTDNSTRPDFKLYSLEEISKIIGVTHRTAWNYVKAGKLKAVKIGGAWKVRAYFGGT